MNIVYYTAGDTLADGEIRRQTLRIPEVLTALKAAQKNRDLDIMSCVSLDDEFRKLTIFQRRELTDIIQHGIFERFCRLRKPYGEIVRRSTYASPAAAAKELKWLLRAGEPIDFYVIGPGLDEMPHLVRDANARFIDVIENDPALDWFWGELKKVANA